MFQIIRLKERAKLHWLQDPSEMNGDNLNNLCVRSDISGIKRGNICKAK
jgi:hypothetical protein